MQENHVATQSRSAGRLLSEHGPGEEASTSGWRPQVSRQPQDQD